MNISEQLFLLLNIKENLKTKLIETGANIDENTPFSEYSKYIFKSVKSAITDSTITNNQPKILKENILNINIDSIVNHNQPCLINENILLKNTDSFIYEKLIKE